MSAIAGFVPRAPGIDAAACVERMLAAMSARGPHGRFVHPVPGGVLGLARLVSTHDRPADEGTVDPNGWTVVADLRLDVRPQACRSLGIDLATASDSAIVAAALAAQGEAAIDGLLGDFAFIAWHGPTGRLLAARDPAGVKPLHVMTTPEGIALASEPGALLALPFAPRDLDEETLADFASGIVDSPDRTFHRGIRRLPAFHLLSQAGRDDAPAVRAYGDYRPAVLAAGTDPAMTLRSLLREAVACRFDPVDAPGILLSGGLDSSSIAVLARDVARERGWTSPLRTFSVTFDETPASSERPEIEQVLALGGLDPTWIPRDGYDPLALIDPILQAESEPVVAPGLGLMYPVYQQIAREGVSVVLDGHAGDEVISHGFARLGELAKAGQWLAFWDAADGASAVYGQSRLLLLLLYGTNFGSGPLWQAVRIIRRAAARLTGRRRTRELTKAGAVELVAEALRSRTAVTARQAERARQNALQMLDQSLDHRATLASGFQSYALEVLDKAYASVGIEGRYPYLDRRVVEFCLAVPASAKLARGFSRLILRRAMDGLLPRAIQWRKTKFNFSGHLAEGLRRWRSAELDRFIRTDAAGIGRAFDMAALRGAHARLQALGPRTDGHDLQLVWRAAVLARWLESRGSDGEVSVPQAETAT